MKQYTIGLDIGTTSVGWSVINNDVGRIEDLGVRHFESAEHPKDGSSLALPRRIARGMRRRLDRRGYRLEGIRDIFTQSKLLSEQEIENAFVKNHDVYEIRSRGSMSTLSVSEYFLAVYHLAKRRGYKSNRKIEEENPNTEGKAVLSGITEMQRQMQVGGYQTVGQLLHVLRCNDTSIGNGRAVRNKAGQYNHCVQRSMILSEFDIISEHMVEGVSAEVIAKLRHEIGFQRPFASGDQIEKMLGKCTFEKSETRSNKSSWAFQMFQFYQKLNHIILVDTGDYSERSLTREERDIIISELFHKVQKIDFKQIRKKLGLSESIQFKGNRYGEKDKGDAVTFVDAKDYHAIRKVVSELDEEYLKLIERDTVLWDKISYSLTVYKTDDDITKALKSLGVPERVIFGIPDVDKRGLLSVSFTKFGHLSAKAIYKILPYLREGMTYDKACMSAGYDHRARIVGGSVLLPPIAQDDRSITNPVVRRSLAQSIKVINAIIRRYGSPTEIHIEMSRNISRDLSERRKIEKEQSENRNQNDKSREILIERYRVTERELPKDAVMKDRFYREQGGKCAYTQSTIDENRLLEDNYVEIDHIIPYSRSWDDSQSNKVLVLTSENRNKANRTPYEYFGSDAGRWDSFVAWVNSLHVKPSKKRKLLQQNYKIDGMTARALNDTSYVAKYLRNYIEDNLKFAEGDKKKRVVEVNGTTTAYLRKRWGFNKDRRDDLLHHAQDAVLVGVINESLIRRVAYYSKIGEVSQYLLAHKTAVARDPETGSEYDQQLVESARSYIVRRDGATRDRFPEPWDGFRKEVVLRTQHGRDNENLGVDAMRSRLHEDVPHYMSMIHDELQFVHPIFVSKMPVRKITGSVHADTRRSPKLFADGKSFVKKPLTSIKLKDLENMRGRTEDIALFELLHKRLVDHNDDPIKAFAEPVYKPTRSGAQGPLVRSIKIINNNQKSGLVVNEGRALVDAESMIRVDVFSKTNKKGKKEFYLIPLYSYHVGQPKLPNAYCVAGKREDEWVNIDGSYEFEFSLQKNDYVKLTKGDNVVEGYYIGMGRSTASINLISHDSSKELPSNGVKTLDSMVKYSVDILGRLSKIQSEIRLPLRS